MAEWAAYFRIEPETDTRADYLAAAQLAMLGNIHRDARQRDTPFDALDFMPWVERKTAMDTPADTPMDAQAVSVRLKALLNQTS